MVGAYGVNKVGLDCRVAEAVCNASKKECQYMKRSLFLIIVTVCLYILPVSALSHGTKSAVEQGGLAVSAQYDTGEPMDYAKVTISGPDAKLPFQSGRTDRNGRFCFFPDRAGEWKMVVDDEMGHRLEVRIPVDESLALQQGKVNRASREAGASRFEKAAMGMSIIFGFFGVFFWWKGRKRASTKLETSGTSNTS